MRYFTLGFGRFMVLAAIRLIVTSESAMCSEPEKSSDADRLTTKTYDVRGLAHTDNQPLQDLCEAIIAPPTWQSNGGEATMSFLDTKLTVRQKAAAHGNLASLLVALRKLPKGAEKTSHAPRETQIVVGTQKSGAAEMQIVIYSVGDLVVRKSLDDIEEHITTTVEPNSWVKNGGQASIQSYIYSPALVISNTKEAQKEIAEVLEKLRPAGKARNGKK